MPTDTNTGNSYASRQADEKKAKAEVPQEELKPVVTGTVIRRKQPFHKKVIRTFIGDDGTTGVMDYVINTLIVPATKDLIVDVATSTVERIFLGDSPRGPRRSRSYGTGSRVDYAGVSSSRTMRREDRRPEMTPRGRMLHDFDDIELSSRAEVDVVLEDMFDHLKEFDVVTVADFYRLVGQSSSFADTKYGWEGPGSLSGARATRLPRGGYLIDLPRPVELRD